MLYRGTKNKRRPRYRVRPRFFVNMFVLALCACGFVLLLNRLYFPAQQTANQPAKPPRHEKNTLPLAMPDPSAAQSAAPETASTTTGETNEGAATEIDKQDWRLTLVNASHPLPEGFTVQTRGLPSGLQIDARIRDDLMDMIHAGEQEGLAFIICSAYRSTQKQQELFLQQVSVEQNKGNSYDQAVTTTKTKVALPGTSEHNLGLAADIVAENYQKLDQGYLQTPECKWLAEHCCEYGFIMRYPDGKSDITKIIFEPWHYRYVGVEAATEIMSKGLCLEEYLDETD